MSAYIARLVTESKTELQVGSREPECRTHLYAEH